MTTDATTHPTATRAQWRAARLALLEREKQLTRLSDELARERAALPWVPVEREYRFETEHGTRTLAELFDGRSQLLVQHFMFGPRATDGCPSCSLWADHHDAALPHLHARDVTLAVVSRGPLDRLLAYRERMGWTFPWVSSLGSEFNFDYGVSFDDEHGDGEYNFAPAPGLRGEVPGFSAFALRGGVVHHAYSAYARGTDILIGAYQLLDRSPRGRDEDGFPFPAAWVRRHDEYAAAAGA